MNGRAYPYRGFMLDVARHYMPVADILRFIDVAAACGMNRFHWHLTDDQGWRVEIKRYPKLTEIGSRRGESHFGRVSKTENNDGFYTQEEVRQVVAHCAERGIQVVPELEVPGHASAMLAAYPEYGCGVGAGEKPHEYRVITAPGVYPNLICAGKDAAIRFLEDILDELLALFPGPEVHIGGDEAIKQHWRRCPDCQRRMREHGLTDENALQRWLVLEIGAYLKEKGKKAIVWNESLQGGLLPDNFIVQHWWRDDEETKAFMAAGGKAICSDTTTYYISRPYEGLDVHDIWQAPALPDWAKDHPESLLGTECPMWGERCTNPARAEYLLFPRIPAIALKALRPDETMTWEAFQGEVARVMERVAAKGIVGAPKDKWHVPPEVTEAEKARMEAARAASPQMKETWRICDGLLHSEAIEKLMKKIDMPVPFARKVMECAFSAVPEYFGDAPVDASDGADVMTEHLLTAMENRDKGAWLGIEEDIFVATMGAFSRFVKEHYASTGRYAFDRGFWTTRQAGATLFRIGELEYELVEREGARTIHLHIPSDAVLEPDRLNESVARARAFFAAHRPEWAEAPMTLHTWLLSPKLRELLPEGSRILRFQKAFDIDRVDPDEDGGVEWIFRLTGAQAASMKPADYPERTTLQRAAKALMLRGGHVGEAGGVLARAFE